MEFAPLNFDFHPQAIRRWLTELGFRIETTLTVSHFRLGLLKRILPAGWLAALDGLFQPTGAFVQLTPSVFLRAVVLRLALSSPRRRRCGSGCNARPVARIRWSRRPAICAAPTADESGLCGTGFTTSANRSREAAGSYEKSRAKSWRPGKWFLVTACLVLAGKGATRQSDSSPG